MTTFNYQEKVVYITAEEVILRDVWICKDLLTTTHNIFPKDYEIKFPICQTAIAYDGNKIVAVGLFNEGDMFGIVHLDKGLNLIQYDFEEGHMGVKQVLEKSVSIINFDNESVVAKFGDNPILPYQIDPDDYHLSTYRNKDLAPRNMCYDPYDDTLILMFENVDKDKHMFEIWKKYGEWQLHKRSRMMTISLGRMVIHHLGCSRQNILIGVFMGDRQIVQRISYVIDKKSFLVVDMFAGCHPVFFDDYQDWFDDRLHFLTKLHVLSSLSVDLLKIILLY